MSVIKVKGNQNLMYDQEKTHLAFYLVLCVVCCHHNKYFLINQNSQFTSTICEAFRKTCEHTNINSEKRKLIFQKYYENILVPNEICILHNLTAIYESNV
jgi:hypothetical protein